VLPFGVINDDDDDDDSEVGIAWLLYFSAVLHVYTTLFHRHVVAYKFKK